MAEKKNKLIQFDKDLAKRAEDFIENYNESNIGKVSFTSLVTSALEEYLDNHE